MNKPIILLGLPGSGKTYWGSKLADNLQLPFYDLDKLISQEAGLTIREIFDEGGETLFRSLESSTLFAICQNPTENNFVLALGGGTPAFNNNMKLINTLATSVFLNVGIETIGNNLQQDKENHRPLLEQADRKIKGSMVTILFIVFLFIAFYP